MILFELLYLLGVKTYGAGIWVYSFFNKKADQWIQGRKTNFSDIKNFLRPGERRIWFHCPSLGEYEQGRPVLEAIKREFPHHKLVVTFFSPSGYQIAKKSSLADYIFYMPLDGPLNASHFIHLVKPEMAFFVKYDFWHYYIKVLKDKKIPSYYISSIFRPSQIYFKWYGIFFERILRRVTHFFVQNQASLEILYQNSIPSVTVSGDTRFDRVYENSLHPMEFPYIRQFKGNSMLIVAGSIWPIDETVLLSSINENLPAVKWLLVPHEINEVHLAHLLQRLNKRSIRYSEIQEKTNLNDLDVIIIDNVGMLSSLYAYADIVYVGGGFGAGIHNILEAAVYGLPLIFGPRYDKFQEAKDLVALHGAFSIRNKDAFPAQFHNLVHNADERNRIRRININYVNERKGATEIIMNFLRMNHQN